MENKEGDKKKKEIGQFPKEKKKEEKGIGKFSGIEIDIFFPPRMNRVWTFFECRFLVFENRDSRRAIDHFFFFKFLKIHFVFIYVSLTKNLSTNPIISYWLTNRYGKSRI